MTISTYLIYWLTSLQNKTKKDFTCDLSFITTPFIYLSPFQKACPKLTPFFLPLLCLLLQKEESNSNSFWRIARHPSSKMELNPFSPVPHWLTRAQHSGPPPLNLSTRKVLELSMATYLYFPPFYIRGICLCLNGIVPRNDEVWNHVSTISQQTQ